MGRKSRHIHLSPSDENTLTEAHQKGLYLGRRSVRGQILLFNHQGKTIRELQAQFELSQPTVSTVLSLYETQGLQAALTDKPRSGAPMKLTEALEAHVTYLACNQPPEGRARWTVLL